MCFVIRCKYLICHHLIDVHLYKFFTCLDINKTCLNHYCFCCSRSWCQSAPLSVSIFVSHHHCYSSPFLVIIIVTHHHCQSSLLSVTTITVSHYHCQSSFLFIIIVYHKCQSSFLSLADIVNQHPFQSLTLSDNTSFSHHHFHHCHYLVR